MGIIFPDCAGSGQFVPSYFHFIFVSSISLWQSMEFSLSNRGLSNVLLSGKSSMNMYLQVKV